MPGFMSWTNGVLSLAFNDGVARATQGRKQGQDSVITGLRDIRDSGVVGRDSGVEREKTGQRRSVAEVSVVAHMT